MEKNIRKLYNTSPLSQNAGLLIKELRVSKGMSGEVLAGYVGISQQQVSRYECGATKLTLEQLQNITNVFNISIFEFMNMLYFFCNKKEDVHQKMK